MKIGLTISKLEPSDIGIYVGGSVNALLTLCKGIKNSGVNMEIVTCIPEDKIRIFYKHKPIDTNFRIFRNNAKPQSVSFSIIYLFKTLAWAFTRFGRKVSIIHGHSGYAGYVWVSFLSGLIIGCPKIHTLYCPIDKKYKSGFIKKLFFNDKFTYFPLSQLDHIIAMSRNVYDSLVKIGIDKNKIRVIPNGIDTEKYSPAHIDVSFLHNQLNLSKHDKTILFVGNLVPAKGLDILIEALSYVVKEESNCKLIVTLELEHEGFHKILKDIKGRLTQLGLENHFLQLGMIDYMPQLLATSDVVVAPYRNTNGPSDYPLALMEAMASGTCVIGTNVGGIPELIENEKDGYLVEPDNIMELAEAILKALSNPDIRKLMGEHARKKIEEHYSIDKVTQNHLELYQQVIS